MYGTIKNKGLMTQTQIKVVNAAPFVGRLAFLLPFSIRLT
jgi:hypothetical protein